MILTVKMDILFRMEVGNRIMNWCLTNYKYNIIIKYVKSMIKDGWLEVQYAR
jgi:hypothetical protein